VSGQIFSNIVTAVFRHGWVAVVQLIKGLLIARVLGPAGNGFYGLLLLLPTTLMTFLNMGIPAANAYFLGRHEVLVSVLGVLNVCFIGISTLLALLIVCVLFYFTPVFGSLHSSYLWFGLILFPLLMLQTLVSSILQGKKLFPQFNFLAVIAPTAGLSLLISLIVIESTVDTLLMLTIISELLGAIFAVFFLVQAAKQENKAHKREIQDFFKKNHLKTWINYGLRSHLSNVVTFLNYRIDVFLVGFFLNSVEIGCYLFSVQLAERLWIISNATASVSLPYQIEENSQNKSSEITVMAAKVVFLSTTITCCLLLFFLLPLFLYFLGPAYSAVYGVMLLLSPGVIALAVSRIFSNAIAASGRPEWNGYTSLLILVLNVSLNLALIPIWTLRGAAIATSVTYLANTLIRILLFSRISNLQLKDILFFNLNDLKLYKVYVEKIMRRIGA
jgi:O-antigen/teichoic acid export membrane protein